MFTFRSRRAGFFAAAAACLTTAAAQETPNLGDTPSPELIAAWDISIEPDGTGLPPGSGTAIDGAPLYAINCIACHGPGGEGLLNDRLVGGHGTIGSDSATKTVGSYWPYATTIFDYIRRAMPFLQPQSLSDDETYALTAYLLYLNEIIDEDDVMNADTLPSVEMPNVDNFILAYPEQ
jgi:cytochrome c